MENKNRNVENTSETFEKEKLGELITAIVKERSTPKWVSQTTLEKWKKIREELFDPPFPNFSLFEFNRGGSKNRKLVYESLFSTDPTIDLRKDALLATLTRDGRNFYKAFQSTFQEMTLGRLDQLYTFIANRSNFRHIFLTELKRGVFLKFEGKMSPNVVNNPRSDSSVMYSGEDLEIRGEKSVCRVEMKKGSVQEEGIPLLLKHLLKGVWNSTREVIKQRKLGSLGYIDFLFEVSTRESPFMLRLKEKEGTSAKMLIFQEVEELKKIGAVRRIREKIFFPSAAANSEK